MTFSTTRIEVCGRRVGAPRRRVGDGRRAFTLAEVIIAATIGSFILAGVLSAFLMLGRSGMNAAHYSMSESELRRAIEEFSQDVRMASDVTWNSAQSITLTVPNNYANFSNRVTYAYDASTSGATAQCFYRTPRTSDAAAGSAGTMILVRNVSSCTYERFNRLDTHTDTDTEAKRIQLTLNVRRTGATLVAANTMLVSASYTLRNKPAN